MVMGRWEVERQRELFVATDRAAKAPRHVFYERLNSLLREAGFDRWVEGLCEEFYSERGRGSIPPGRYFRMLFIGYFEGIDSQRGIAWRCDDSLSLKVFLGLEPFDEAPDHSSLTKIGDRLPTEVYREVFQFVLRMVQERGLLKGQTVGVDSTLLEANAAMKSIVRKDSGDDWEDYLKKLAAAEGRELKSKAELIRFDKDRNKKDGGKKVSNDDWQSPSDPDARIAKMKDGTTHLAYKAEHAVDLETEVILAAEIYAANHADSATIEDTLSLAGGQVVEVTHGTSQIAEAVADKGYHKAETLARLTDHSDSHRDTEHSASATNLGLRTYIAEPDAKHKRRWTDKPPAWETAYRGNRRRIQGSRGKSWQRRRSEVVERSFAHVCETGGARRTWLRGLTKVTKRYQLQTAAHNLGLILRQLLGAAKPRAFAAFWSLAQALLSRLHASPQPWSTPQRLRAFQFRYQLRQSTNLAT